MTFAADYREFTLVRPVKRMALRQIIKLKLVEPIKTSGSCHPVITPRLTSIGDKNSVAMRMAYFSKEGKC
jgi:hypothetical protein